MVHLIVRQPKHYIVVLSPQHAQIVMAGLGELPGKVMFEAATDIKRQIDEQNANANKLAESVSPAAQ